MNISDVFTIADLAIWPWIYALHEIYDDAIAVSRHIFL